MTVGAYDGNDTYVLGDDGSEDGVKITSTTDGAKKRLDVEAKLNGTATVAETEIATFVAVAQGIAIGNGKSMISLLNATGSGVIVKLREAWIVSAQTTAVTGVLAQFQLLRMTGHSAGTSITPLPYDTADTINVNVTARTGATIAGAAAVNLKRWYWSTDEYGVGAQDVESMDHTANNLNPHYIAAGKTKPITIRAGEGLTINQITNSTVGSFDLYLVFTQETA
jgi:hypothetical protein